jgi:hypothetical protein
MFKLEKDLLNLVIKKLIIHQKIVEEIATTMNCQEHKKYFQGKREGYIEAANLLKNLIVQL